MRQWCLSLCMGGVFSAEQTPPVQSDKYQCRLDTVVFSWWWANGCPKHVEKKNKYIKQNCAHGWIYLRDVSVPLFQRKSHMDWSGIEMDFRFEESANNYLRYWMSLQMLGLIWIKLKLSFRTAQLPLCFSHLMQHTKINFVFSAIHTK